MNHTKNSNNVVWILVGIFIGTIVIIFLGFITLWRKGGPIYDKNIEKLNIETNIPQVKSSDVEEGRTLDYDPARNRDRYEYDPARNRDKYEYVPSRDLYE